MCGAVYLIGYHSNVWTGCVILVPSVAVLFTDTPLWFSLL